MPTIFSYITQKKHLSVIFLILVVVLCYGNTLWNGYTLDDDMVINTQTEQGVSAIPKIFTNKYVVRQQHASSYGYRPVVLSSFAIEMGLLGKQAALSHAINVVLFALIVAILFIGILYFAGNEHRTTAIVASLLFALHPIHTEVVASLKSRDELLAFLFAGLAVGAFSQYLNGKWWGIIVGSVLFLLACLSKPTAIPLLFLLPFAFYWFRKSNLSQSLQIGGALLLPFMVVPLITRNIESEQGHTAKRLYSFFENPMQDFSLIERIPTGVYCIAKYAALHLVPHPLLSYYGYNQIPILSWNDTLFWIATAFVLLLLGGLWWWRQQRIAFFAILWWAINLLTYSNIIKTAPGIIAERLLFIGSFGFCLLLAVGWERGRLSNRYATQVNLSLTVLCLLFAAQTIRRNAAWKDDLTLFGTDIAYQEQSFKGNMLYAGALAANQQYPLAEQYYREAISILPQYNVAWNNLGYMYVKQRRFEDAWTAFKKAYTLDSLSPETNFNLAETAQQFGQKDTAKYYYQKTIDIDPKSIQAQKAYYSLSNWLIKKGNYDQAITLLQNAVQQQNNNVELLENLAQTYLLQQNLIAAIDIWEKMVPLLPNNKVLYYKLQKANESIGNQQKAHYYQQRLTALGGMIIDE